MYIIAIIPLNSLKWQYSILPKNSNNVSAATSLYYKLNTKRALKSIKSTRKKNLSARELLKPRKIVKKKVREIEREEGKKRHDNFSELARTLFCARARARPFEGGWKREAIHEGRKREREKDEFDGRGKYRLVRILPRAVCARVPAWRVHDTLYTFGEKQIERGTCPNGSLPWILTNVWDLSDGLATVPADLCSPSIFVDLLFSLSSFLRRMRLFVIYT